MEGAMIAGGDMTGGSAASTGGISVKELT
jgi:hypothetical protein